MTIYIVLKINIEAETQKIEEIDFIESVRDKNNKLCIISSNISKYVELKNTTMEQSELANKFRKHRSKIKSSKMKRHIFINYRHFINPSKIKKFETKNYCKKWVLK